MPQSKRKSPRKRVYIMLGSWGTHLHVLTLGLRWKFVNYTKDNDLDRVSSFRTSR